MSDPVVPRTGLADRTGNRTKGVAYHQHRLAPRRKRPARQPAMPERTRASSEDRCCRLRMRHAFTDMVISHVGAGYSVEIQGEVRSAVCKGSSND
jgi:hypothetical protein